MTTIKKGSRGEDVKTLQRKLYLTSDGVFGPKTEEAVKKFQKDHFLTPDGVVGPRTWAALGVKESANPRRITEIIVHCEATPEGEEFSRATLEECHKARNFTAYQHNGKTEHIGYHYVIHLDGTIEACRPEAIAGCHCTDHNRISIGVSYVGGCPPRSVKGWKKMAKDTRTPAQKAALITLLKELKSRYPDAKIYGHRDFANKPCPSFDAKNEYKNL